MSADTPPGWSGVGRAHALVLAAAVAAALAGGESSAADAQPAKVSRLFRARCSTCHGNDGKGQTEMGRKLSVPDFSDPKFQASQTDADFTRQVREGSRSVPDGGQGMPAFAADLSAEQVGQLVQLVRSFAVGR